MGAQERPYPQTRIFRPDKEAGTMKLKIKGWLIKSKEWTKIAGYFIVDCLGWINSLLIYVFRSIQRPGIFYGYRHFWWAQKYAERRTKNWNPEWDQSGRQQGVFPIEEIKLIVCSKLELKIYKKKRLVKQDLKPRKAIKKSYYTTQLT